MLFLFHFRCQVCASESFDAGGERRREQLEAMLQIMADLDDNGCQEMQLVSGNCSIFVSTGEF
jgi:hypothetical protein